jgi:ABC-type Fe3+/spermidine/putrescine transport system ATPase subunit
VALARALVKRPRLLLLDEPLAALDRKLRGAMQLELKRLQHDVGITFVVVTHDQEEALVMADRVAVLNGGRLMQVDTPHNVYERPANRFVADFIGVMNFVDGRTTERGLIGRDGSQITCLPMEGLQPGTTATAAVRPERVVLDPGPAQSNRTSGKVLALAYQGLDVQLHIATSLSDKPFLVRVTASAADKHPVNAGDAVSIGWSAEDTRIFRD